MALERIQPFHLASFDPSLSLSVSPPQKKKKKQYASDTLDTHQSMKRTIRKSKQVVQESESEEEEIVVSVLFLLYSFFERERERGRREEKGEEVERRKKLTSPQKTKNLENIIISKTGIRRPPLQRRRRARRGGPRDVRPRARRHGPPLANPRGLQLPQVRPQDEEELGRHRGGHVLLPEPGALLLRARDQDDGLGQVHVLRRRRLPHRGESVFFPFCSSSFETKRDRRARGCLLRRYFPSSHPLSSLCFLSSPSPKPLFLSLTRCAEPPPLSSTAPTWCWTRSPRSRRRMRPPTFPGWSRSPSHTTFE